MENIFYVYIILDPRKFGKFIYNELTFDYEPFYVGRGKTHRIKSTLKQGNDYKMKKINKIIKENQQPILFKLFENLSFEDSLIKEMEIIKKIGRYDLNTGPLLNFTDGGDGVNNPIVSIETRNKMRNKRIGVEPWNKGKTWNKETRNKISESLKGEKNFNYGKHFSDEHKRKISESNKEPQCKPIMQFDMEGNFIKEYKSIIEASILTGINKSSIGKTCNQIFKSAGGFKWKFTGKTKINKKEINKPIKEKIINLLKENKTVIEITKILNCNSTKVYYYKNKNKI
jgi:hypothetical protein